MQVNYQTERLLLNKLTIADTEFIRELVNTQEWIAFIGDRSIHTIEDAKKYVQKIIDNPNITYWVVKLKHEALSIGIITFIKRDYLASHDIGFAFLPEYAKKGYAFEAAASVLNDAIISDKHRQILATTMRENTNSINLLNKLGLRFEKEIQVEKDVLSIYAITADKFFINKITKDFFDLFTNSKQRQIKLEKIVDLCLPETLIIKKSVDKEEIYNLESFIKPRKKMLSDGSLVEFEEFETAEETVIHCNLAHRISKYKKKGNLNGQFFEGNGTKFFQYIKTNNSWKISSMVWEDENH